MSQGFFRIFRGVGRLGQFLGLFFLGLVLMVSCSTQPVPESPSSSVEGGRIAIGTTLKPRTLDPADNYELAGLMIIYNLSDRLYTYELGSTTLKPQLATAMPQISEDGLTYTIPVRQDVTFHDGTPFNAEAMAFSLQRFIDNEGQPSFLLKDTIADIQVTGDYELTIQLKQPFAAFTALLAFPGACAVSPNAYTIGEGQFNPAQFFGTGPYKLTEFSSDVIRLEAFGGYWGEQPKNQAIDLQIYAGNSANLFNAFRTGAIDVAYQSLDTQQIQTLQAGAEEEKWQVIEAPGTAVSYMALNLQSEPLDQLPVRQAIAALMDRSLLNERVLQGQGQPLYSLVPTTFASSQPVFQTAYGDADFDQAKDLLQEAGYSVDNPITVEIWHPSGSTPRAIIASTLKAIADERLDGMIQFEPKSIERASFFNNLRQGIYPTALADWYPDFLDADNYLQPFLYCAQGSPETGCEEGGSKNQGSFFYNDRLNQLIDQQRAEQDPNTRQAILGEIQQILAENVPYIPLWQSKDYAFFQNSVSGVNINPSQTFPFWTIERQS